VPAVEVVFVVPVPLKEPVQVHDEPLQPEAVKVSVVPTHFGPFWLNEGVEGVETIVPLTLLVYPL
jgi:hypothetical protein